MKNCAFVAFFSILAILSKWIITFLYLQLFRLGAIHLYSPTILWVKKGLFEDKKLYGVDILNFYSI